MITNGCTTRKWEEKNPRNSLMGNLVHKFFPRQEGREEIKSSTNRVVHQRNQSGTNHSHDVAEADPESFEQQLGRISTAIC